MTIWESQGGLPAEEVPQRDGQINAGGFPVKEVWAPNAAGTDVELVWRAPLGGFVEGNPFTPGNIVAENADDGWFVEAGIFYSLGIDANDNLDLENQQVPSNVPSVVSMNRRIRVGQSESGLRVGQEYDFTFVGGPPIGLVGYGGDVLLEMTYTDSGGLPATLFDATVPATTFASGAPVTFRRTVPELDPGSNRMLAGVGHVAPAWGGGFPYPDNRRGRVVLAEFSVVLV